MRLLKAGLATLVVGGLMAGAVASGAGGERPRSLAVLAGGEKVRASQGTWCYSGPRTATCADYGYPLRIKNRLRVSPGDRIRFELHDASIATLSASLLRVRDRRIRDRGELQDIERVPANPRAWRVTIPAGARRANVIDVFVRYEDGRGDSDWWAGIRLRD